MKILLLLAIGTGHYVFTQMNNPSSDLSRTAQQIVSDFQNEFDSGNGGGDYESSNYGRPNTMDWAARGGSSVGSPPNLQPVFGGTDELVVAKREMDDAYASYEYMLKTYGATSYDTQVARRQYIDAKFQYDALTDQVHRNGGW